VWLWGLIGCELKVSAQGRAETCSIVDQWRGNSACGTKLADDPSVYTVLGCARWQRRHWNELFISAMFEHARTFGRILERVGLEQGAGMPCDTNIYM